MDFKSQKGMIIIAFIISGLLITVYAMFQGNGSEGPIYGPGASSGYGSSEPIPMPPDVLQNQEMESRVQGLLVQTPESPTLLAELGDLYFERAEFFQAAQEYEKVIKLAPDDIDSYNDLGLSYFYIGRSEDAIGSFNKGIEKDPSFQRIWLSLGFVQASNGNMDEARKALGKAIEIDPASGVGIEAQRILGSIVQ